MKNKNISPFLIENLIKSDVSEDVANKNMLLIKNKFWENIWVIQQKKNKIMNISNKRVII